MLNWLAGRIGRKGGSPARLPRMQTKLTDKTSRACGLLAADLPKAKSGPAITIGARSRAGRTQILGIFLDW